MSTGNQYTDAQLIKKLKDHVMDEHLSKYTMAYPVWQTYVQRMGKDAEFKSKVHNLLAVSEQYFEKLAIENITNKDFNTQLWTKLTCNKAFSKDHVAIDLEDRIQAIEDAQPNK